jgi:hypothetical protein
MADLVNEFVLQLFLGAVEYCWSDPVGFNQASLDDLMDLTVQAVKSGHLPLAHVMGSVQG